MPASQHQNPKSDIEISQAAKMRPIVEVAAEKLDIPAEYVLPYGHYKAKLSLAYVESLGANVVYFNDDNFLREPDRVGALCESILRRGLRLSWLADARVDDVVPEVIRQ